MDSYTVIFVMLHLLLYVRTCAGTAEDQKAILENKVMCCGYWLHL